MALEDIQNQIDDPEIQNIAERFQNDTNFKDLKTKKKSKIIGIFSKMIEKKYNEIFPILSHFLNC